MAETLTVTPLGKVTDKQIVHVTELGNTGLLNVRHGPCTLLGGFAINTDAGNIAYLKLYDTDGEDFVAGTSLPHLMFPIPASGNQPFFVEPSVQFLNGLTLACSEESGNTLTTAPASLEVYLITS